MRIPAQTHLNLMGFPPFIGIQFFPISKLGYGVGNGDIDIQSEPILKPVPEC